MDGFPGLLGAMMKKDGFPVMVVEEAELPAGCEGLEQLAGKHEVKDAAHA